ncbi:MAG: hypothetical protein AAFW70_03885 [Cyanobacteria bacterium J06635_10]
MANSLPCGQGTKVILTTGPSCKALLVEKTLYRQFFYPNVHICTNMGRYLEAVLKQLIERSQPPLNLSN